jgi:hypothetical protein
MYGGHVIDDGLVGGALGGPVGLARLAANHICGPPRNLPAEVA